MKHRERDPGQLKRETVRARRWFKRLSPEDQQILGQGISGYILISGLEGKSLPKILRGIGQIDPKALQVLESLKHH